MPLIGDSLTTGWSDLVATGAVHTGSGDFASTARDKKARSLRSALENLERAGLVELQGPKGTRGRHENFIVLDDIGSQRQGDPVRYTVPMTGDFFSLPAGLLTNGWIHVLEDSEIVVLLMLACGKHGLDPRIDGIDVGVGEIAIPAESRLRWYGIHRDPFSTARKTLEWFGLISVREVDRHYSDGRGEDGATQLHRIKLNLAGFEDDGIGVVTGAVDAQLERAR